MGVRDAGTRHLHASPIQSPSSVEQTVSWEVEKPAWYQAQFKRSAFPLVFHRLQTAGRGLKADFLPDFRLFLVFGCLFVNDRRSPFGAEQPGRLVQSLRALAGMQP